jgi:hypothetical protein
MLLSHLTDPPDRAFWCDKLCFEEFDDLMVRLGAGGEAERLLDEWVGHGRTRRFVESIIAEAGGMDEPRHNVILALGFVRHRRSQAIEDAAAAFLTPEAIEAHRGPTGKVRRHELALTLYVTAPESLAAIELWDQWHSRRGARYRLEHPLAERLDVADVDWRTHVLAALAHLAEQPQSQFASFEAPVLFPGAEGDVLVGLREWPRRGAVRSEGRVVTGDEHTWMLIRIYDGGQRIDVTDTVVDRGAHLATAVVNRVRPGAGEFEQVLDHLDDEVLDRFVATVTAPTNESFPLVEITAEIPWDVRHRSLTVRATPAATAEEIVAVLRELGPFAARWRTVKSVKLLFEQTYKIEVHFPIEGRHQALTYSDIDRDKRVTRRFAESLNSLLGCEVAPKARRGSRVPAPKTSRVPTERTTPWWRRLLVAKHDRPPEWVERALNVLAAEGVVRLAEVRVLACGSPYLDRSAAGADWAECGGEVELPLKFGEPDDPCQPEDDGAFLCSERNHRWFPARYRLPGELRLKVEFDHQALWALVLRELAHYGEVHEERGRRGVASVQLDDSRVMVAYTGLADREDLATGAFGRVPVALIAAPLARLPATLSPIELAAVLGGDDVLGPAWGLEVRRHRTPRAVLQAPGRGVETADTRVIELHTEREVLVDGRGVVKQVPSVYRLARLLHLADVAEGTRRSRTAKLLVEMARQHGILTATSADTHLHVLVRRAREGVDSAYGVDGRGEEAFVTTSSGYRLGDGWEVRLRAASSEPKL